MKNKKILFISCEPLDLSTNVGTTIFNNLLDISGYEYYQIFTNNIIPKDNVFIKEYFRITTNDILLNKLKNYSQIGKVINIPYHTSLVSKKNNESRILRFFLKFRNSNLLRLLRDILWIGDSWTNKGLSDWVDKIKPDLVFLMALNNPYLIRLASNLSYQQGSIPVIIYATDDYLHRFISISPFYWIRNVNLNLKFKNITKSQSNSLLTISEEMKRYYFNRFHKDSNVLLNYEILCKPQKLESKRNLRLVYAGNLHLNRAQTILKLLRAINLSGYGEYIAVDLYSNKFPNNVKTFSEENKNVNLYDFVSPNLIKKVLSNYDILIHVESFAMNDLRITKYSFSTKITTYISLGLPILAIGPMEINSIKFLMDNKIAHVVTSKKIRNIISVIPRLFDAELNSRIVLGANKFLSVLYEEYDLPNKIGKIINKALE
jgi:hypothetical protein